VPPRPNIVLILSDDQRWDTIGGTHGIGGEDVMPQARAQIGGEGVTFENAFMTTPLCCPSRSSLLSGQYAHRTGVYSNQGENGGADDFDDRLSMGVWLQANGYRTGFVGKYLNGYADLWTNPDPPYVPPGWDEWHAFPGARFYNYKLVRNGIGFDHFVQSFGSAETDYSTDVLRDIAVDFIETSVQQGEPFFLYFAPKAPHLPRQPAPRHIGLFADVPQWRPPNHNEADVSDKPSWVRNTPLLSAAEIADMDDLRQNQLEMLQAVDEAIGGSDTFSITGILPTLRNLGVLDDTIVIYISDNGYHWGEHRFTAKNKPYEESIRTHMMVRYPKLAPLPRTESRFALNIDIAPTLAELAGFDIEAIAQQIDPSFFVDGVSFTPLLDGSTPPEPWRTDFLTEGWPASHVWATVREGQWKYTELPVTPGEPDTDFEIELYDLVNDPYELANLESDPQHEDRIDTMAARLRDLRQNWPLDSDPTVELPEEED
jgi:arylsulfatase A-like enzyme